MDQNTKEENLDKVCHDGQGHGQGHGQGKTGRSEISISALGTMLLEIV